MPSHYEQLKFGEQKRTRKGEWIECETCHRLFYVMPARIRQAQRQGAAIRFCSMACYDKTGEKNPFWGKKHSPETVTQFIENPDRNRFALGDANPDAHRFGAGFRGTTRAWWKKYLVAHVGHCERCGYSEHTGILQIHHIDRNGRHNTRANVLLLCPICHELDHFTARDGAYKGMVDHKTSAHASRQ